MVGVRDRDGGEESGGVRVRSLRSPLKTSPSASGNVFPCSRVMLAASSF